MKQTRVSVGFAVTVIIIVALWFWSGHLLTMARLISYDNQKQAMDDAIAENQQRVTKTIEALALRDEVLKGCIEKAVALPARIREGDRGRITDVSQLTYLNCSRKEVRDLSGIEGLTELRILELGSNKISDVTPLYRLRQLETLDLSANQITTIEPLKDLNELRSLDLWRNPVEDIRHIGSLSKLERLALPDSEHVHCADLEYLATLPHVARATEVSPGLCKGRMTEEIRAILKKDRATWTATDEEKVLAYEIDQSRQRYDALKSVDSGGHGQAGK